MLKKISGLLLLMVSLLVWGCTSESGTKNETGQSDTVMQEESHEEDQEQGEMETEGEQSEHGSHFGEKITPQGAISFEEMVRQLKQNDSINVKVQAKVDAVCQKKGCWMNVTSPGKPMPDSLFVRFKDYGFFVPKDISGREVVMRGKAYTEVTPVDELRHYAEDAGKSEEEIQQITEPKEETKFLADGVLLLPEESPMEKQ